jgi:AraC-like DNA-binding protein
MPTFPAGMFLQRGPATFLSSSHLGKSAGMTKLATPKWGIERRTEREIVARHRHGKGYAALVLAGSYEEAGQHGRCRLGAGDVVLHSNFDAHQNRIGLKGAKILNIPLAFCTGSTTRVGRCDALDRIVFLSERDLPAAAFELSQSFKPILPLLADWPDQLAAALAEDPRLSMWEWAREHGLAPSVLSRGFKMVFGISPIAYRAEARARRAWRRIAGGSEPLVSIALDVGFADQSHMTHAVRDFTGRTPGQWRRSNGYKTRVPTSP